MKSEREEVSVSRGEALNKEEIEDVRGTIEADFSILEQRFISRDGLTIQSARFQCEPNGDIDEKFKSLTKNLKGGGFIPFLKEIGGETWIIVRKHESEEAGGPTTTHLILFFATVLTTMTAGSILFGIDILENPLSFWRGWPFTVAIMLVLGMHESGHYIMSKRRDVSATPPYFIPVPPPFPLGTLGAVIRTKSPMLNRKSMFDIGASGPLLGLVTAIPVTLIGLHLSPIPLPEEGAAFGLGMPPIYWALTLLVPIGEGGIHPVAFAGWVGFFVTFLNLLPVGQLDGGHVSRALLGDLHERISGAVPLFLLTMGFLLTFLLKVNGGVWIFWGFITMFFHSGGHPPPLNDVSGLDKKRKLIGAFVFLLMLGCFTPIPFSIVGS